MSRLSALLSVSHPSSLGACVHHCRPPLQAGGQTHGLPGADGLASSLAEGLSPPSEPRPHLHPAPYPKAPCHGVVRFFWLLCAALSRYLKGLVAAGSGLWDERSGTRGPWLFQQGDHPRPASLGAGAESSLFMDTASFTAPSWPRSGPADITGTVFNPVNGRHPKHRPSEAGLACPIPHRQGHSALWPP